MLKKDPTRKNDRFEQMTVFGQIPDFRTNDLFRIIDRFRRIDHFRTSVSAKAEIQFSDKNEQILAKFRKIIFR